MIVKEIIKQALLLVDRADVIPYLGTGTGSAEIQQTERAMLLCYNAVEDELARSYMPLRSTEYFVPASGKVRFKLFAHYPIRLYSVTRGNEKVPYRVEADGIVLDGTTSVTITYGYAPEAKTINEASSYSDMTGAILLAYGAAAEYCVVAGRGTEALSFDSRYRTGVEEMKRQQDEFMTGTMADKSAQEEQKSLPKGGHIPGRAFV